MAATITFAELKSRIRFLGDFENSRIVTGARLTEVANAAMQAVWDLLLRHRPDACIAETTPASTTIGSQNITLPTAFYDLRLISVLDDGVYRPLEPYNLSEEYRIMERAGGDTARSLRYRIQGSTLKLAPTPSVVYTYKLWYLPTFTKLSADGDTYDGLNGYEALVIAEAIVDLKLREGMPAGEWQAKADKLRAPIIAAATNLDAGKPFYLAGGSPDQDRLIDGLDDFWWMA